MKKIVLFITLISLLLIGCSSISVEIRGSTYNIENNKTKEIEATSAKNYQINNTEFIIVESTVI